jgi:putative acetyltransferase
MKIDEITMRSATNADAEAVRYLIFSVLREYGLEPDPNGTDADLTDIETNYTQRGGLFEVLENTDGEIVGTVGLVPISEEAVELRKMYFARELRGRGLGKQVLQQMIWTARQLNFKKIYLETNSVLTEAIELYKKFGFQPTDEKHSARCNEAFILELKDESTPF